jgi:hypothetical protein
MSCTGRREREIRTSDEDLGGGHAPDRLEQRRAGSRGGPLGDAPELLEERHRSETPCETGADSGRIAGCARGDCGGRRG